MPKARPIKMRFNLRELQDICFCLEMQGIMDPKYIKGIKTRNLIRRLNRVEAYHIRKQVIEKRKRTKNVFREQDKQAVAGHPHFDKGNNEGSHRVDYTYGVQDGIIAHCMDCNVEIKVQ